VGTLACLNLLAFALPWLIGQRMLESNEDEG